MFPLKRVHDEVFDHHFTLLAKIPKTNNIKDQQFQIDHAYTNPNPNPNHNQNPNPNPNPNLNPSLTSNQQGQAGGYDGHPHDQQGQPGHIRGGMGPWGGYAAHQGYSQQGYLGQPGQHQGGMGPWGGYAAHQGYGQQGYVGQPGQHQGGMGP